MALLAAYQVACAVGGSGGTLKSAYAVSCPSGGSSGPTDPDFSNVVLLAPFSSVVDDDASDSNHTLTALNGASIVSGSLELDGTDDAVSMPDSTDWDFGTGDFTLEGFFDRDVNSAFSIVMATATGNAVNGWFFEVGSNRGLVFAANGGLVLSGGGNPLAPAGGRKHIAIVRDGSTIRGFVDGVLWNSATVSGSFNTTLTTGLYIGTSTSGGAPFDGQMGNVRITKGVARYTAAFTAPTEPFPTS